jgi:hypothetical protein
MIKELFPALAATSILTGCMSQGAPAKLPMSRDTPFVLDVPQTEQHSTTARFQQADPQSPPPPPAPGASVMPQMPPAASATGGPTSAARPAGKGSVHVRAWVNGKPIFEDEVFNILGPQIRKIYTEAPPAQRDAELQKAFNKTLEGLIDNELLVQDAIRRLEKDQKHLSMLKSGIAKDVDKQIASQMRAMKIATMEEYKETLIAQGTTLESIRRMLERQDMSGAYLQAKVKPQVEKEVCHETIYEYYTQHKNEFMQLDKVKWQNIFVAVGPKHPTMADAKQFAEQLLQHWIAGEDIGKLLEYDDGDSRFRKGDGAGELKGDIRPRELEPYLFALKEGEFGQPLELSTGVHLYRVLKREYAGQMPFDDKIQTQIRNKLQGEMIEHERDHLVRQLRERALIEIEK